MRTNMDLNPNTRFVFYDSDEDSVQFKKDRLRNGTDKIPMLGLKRGVKPTL